MTNIKVKESEINIIEVNEKDYISLTDMVKKHRKRSCVD